MSIFFDGWGDPQEVPSFGKGVCPYKGLVDEMKGIAGNCPDSYTGVLSRI